MERAEDKRPITAPAPDGLGEDPQASFDAAKSQGLSALRTLQTVSLPHPRFARRSVARLPDSDPQAAGAIPGVDLVEAEYVLERLIGKGGFGEVFEARQTSLGRTIAVKRARNRDEELMPDEEEALRLLFRQEALTTGSLEHPNIVPIYDLGMDPQGRPLLAMKLIRGTPWHRQMRDDFDAMPAADFLGKHIPVLVDVAQAVAFAHSRGIVHRDLKPSQVMVGEFGEVVLMDWGLAIAFDRSLAAEKQSDPFHAAALPTVETASNPSGTPAYMAPEQTEPTAANIGPWTDVFLLGATLYEMLTGTAPYNDRDARLAFFRAQVAEVQPPGERTPGREIPPELSRLALRAMSPRRDARIPSAPEFVRGLQEYLSGSGKRRESEAIAAEAQAALARGANDYKAFGALAARVEQGRALWGANPRLASLHDRVAAGYAELAVHNGDLVLARAQAERIESSEARETLLQRVASAEARARRQARQRRAALAGIGVLAVLLAAGGAKYARDQRLAAERVQSALDRAVAARSDAESILGFMVGDLRQRLQPIGQLAILDDVGSQAMDYFAHLPEEELSAKSLEQRVRVLAQLVEVREAQGDIEGAAAMAGSARKLVDRLAAAAPGQLGALEAEAIVLGREANVAEAKGDLAGAASKYEAAIAATVRAEAASGVRNGRAETIAMNRHRLARVMRQQGRGAEARALLMRAIDDLAAAVALDGTQDSARDQLATLRIRAGRELREEGDLDGAMAQYSEAERELHRLLERSPGDPGFLFALGECAGAMGRTWLLKGENLRAQRSFESARDLYRRLVERDPSNIGWLRELQVGWNTLGVALQRQGKDAEAEQAHRESFAIAERLVQRDPSNTDYQMQKAIAEVTLAQCAEVPGRMEECLNWYRAAIETFGALVSRSPGNRTIERNLQMVRANFASALAQTGDLGGALEVAREANAAARRQREAEPDSAEATYSLVSTLTGLGVAQAEVRMDDSARASYAEALALIDGLLARAPGQRVWLRQKSVLLGRLAELDTWSGAFDEAVARLSEALAIRDGIAEGDPEALGPRRDAAAYRLRLAEVLRAMESPAACAIAAECEREIAGFMSDDGATPEQWYDWLWARYGLGCPHEGWESELAALVATDPPAGMEQRHAELRALLCETREDVAALAADFPGSEVLLAMSATFADWPAIACRDVRHPMLAMVKRYPRLKP